MEAAIYIGSVRHRRFEPVQHEFTYPLFMTFLDIDRIPELMRISRFSSYNRWNWASFAERDHFGDPARSLRARLTADAAANGTALPDGKIFLLTHLRYLGYNFNPISFFYCYDRAGALQTVLAEVNSTFGETQNYWLNSTNRLPAQNALHYRCQKSLHVSPFMPMELDYHFVLTPPGDGLVAHMNVAHRNTVSGEHNFFDATLTLEREPWTAPALRRALLRFPWMTAKVITAIHWEALKLYLKRAPVFTHPARRKDQSHAPTSDIAR